ncbi:hypothetical protein CDAR_34361 [Caerostris darwini]|uniref:Uncharacterized protein n=1 Tax=Caerostris darwini TaxID=1538125 RepID=A0AAV4UYP6_9ARAC|nr:hypothetical protein CDAR_34361 [Caerostris darwini]
MEFSSVIFLFTYKLDPGWFHHLLHNNWLRFINRPLHFFLYLFILLILHICQHFIYTISVMKSIFVDNKMNILNLLLP